jgi:peptidoglycan biosynthesis protein MviN/MurJ (putative lipid II flippase)
VAGLALGAAVRLAVVTLPAARRAPSLAAPAPAGALGRFGASLALLLSCELFHHLNHAVGRRLASGLGESAVSSLAYADRVVALGPFLVFGAVGWALAPRLSEDAAAGRREAFARTAAAGLRLSLLVGLPLAIVLAAAAEPLLSWLFVGGRFGPEDARRCAPVLQAYAPALAGAGTFVLVQAYAALGRLGSLAPVFAGGALLNALLATRWAPTWGAPGIALAFALSTAGCFAVGALLLARWVGPTGGAGELARILGAAIPCGAVAWDPLNLLSPLGALGPAVAAALVYPAALAALGSEDLRLMTAKVRRWAAGSRRMAP